MNLRRSEEYSILNLVRVTTIVSLVIFNLQTSFSPAEAAVSSYSYSASSQSFTVPAGVISVSVSMRGGAGGKGGTDGHPGGTPGRFVGLIQGTINVTPGQVITVAAGQGGGSTSACVTNAGAGTSGNNPLSGYDGGFGGNAGTSGCSGGGGGGGAATVIIVSGISVIAGGGGGSGGGNNIRSDTVQNATSGSTVAGTSGSAGIRPTGDGGGGGGGGGGVNGGAGGTSAKISNSAEFFGYGGNAGTSTTGGISGLIASTSTYTESSNGSVSFTYTADTTAPTITGPSSATGATSSISIAENTTAVHTFTANEAVTWSRSGTDSSFFTISSGGVLTITARDFEAPADVGSNNTYEVTITATDTAGNIANQSISITVTNVNEAPMITTASSNPTHAITQAENISSITTYTATDVDAATTLSWSLSGTDAAAFTINSSSGVLTFITAPDFEAPVDSDSNNIYILIVAVSDGSLSDTQTLTITITNANESSSVGAPAISGTISKRIATTISVTVNTAGKVRFFVGGKRVTKCLARTTTGSYPTLTATCSWRPAVTGRQVLTARLTPTDNTFSASTSVRSEVFVLRRGTVK